MGSYTSSTLAGASPASLLWFPGNPWFAPFGPPEAGILARRLLSGRGSPVHVLMIEDDPSIAEMYRFQLEHDGYRVTIATTAELGFTTMAENTPDIVLLDLLLPDRSGFEVLASLNERFPKHPPVVILSNYGEPSMIDRGRSLGAVEYLVKSRVTPADIAGQIPFWIELGRRGGQGES
jgi:CheY-like chemotaxis protein